MVGNNDLNGWEMKVMFAFVCLYPGEIVRYIKVIDKKKNSDYWY